MIVILIFIVLIAILGAPLFSIIGSTALVNFANSGSGIMVVPQEIAKIADMTLIYSIPLFTFAGYILASSNASRRVVKLTRAALGWLPGGLAIVTLITCAVFTAFTGASGVTIIAIGAFLLPGLLSEKYNEKFSYGLVTASGSIGLLFPPSLPLILFGVVSAASIDKLFIAGIIPGIIIILVFATYSIIFSVKNKIEVTKFNFKELAAALWEIKWEIPLPLLLFAGIYSGKMAISDAAAFTAIYVLVVEIFILKDVKIKELPKIMKESMVLVGAIFIILSCSLAASNYIIDQQIPQKLFNSIKDVITNKLTFLIVLNIFLLIVGCIMDIFSAIAIIVPLILPIAEAYNVNLIHLGIIFLTNLEIGYLTPPVGMNLFVSSIRFNRPIVEIYKSAVLFIGLSFVSLILITYIPDLSVWFLKKPSLVGQWEFVKEDGNIDKIIIKNGGVLLRKEGGMIDIMMNPPSVGSYKIKSDKIIFDIKGDIEEYRYEIYNDGKRLLLKKDEDKVFYINSVMPPLNETEGKFIGKWENNEEYIEFFFNGRVSRVKNDDETLFSYRIKDSQLILDEIFEDNDNYEKHNIKKYRFDIKENKLSLKSKDEELIFSHVVSDSDM